MNTKRLTYLLIGLFVGLLTFQNCKKDRPQPPVDCENGNGNGEMVYDPTPYHLDLPQSFTQFLPPMEIPEDNPMTEEGVELGKKLFFDPILSGDNSQSCASCHDQEFAFSDHNNQFSTGIDGIEGRRTSMPLINLGYMDKLFWDGRSESIEDQAFAPVVDPIEMHETWPNAVSKLKNHSEYPSLFYGAFGTTDIDSTHVVKAIAQFERTLISGNSKFDRYQRGETTLTSLEFEGLNLFITERGDCFHCHGDPTNPLWTDNTFRNNGLDSEFDDLGLGEVTGNPNDYGKFKVPTLRNLVFSAPYMHDGRFSTIDEVIEHYSSGLQSSPTIDPMMKYVSQGGGQFSEDEKAALKAFLLTLTDDSFIENPDFKP